MQRRAFLRTAATVAGGACGGTAGSPGRAATADDAAAAADAAGGPLVDTFVSLFPWPFRRLPLDTTERLVARLRALGIGEAWAGSFEALLARDIAGVNERLVAECGRFAGLVPFGAVNPTLPGWERDLEACLGRHALPGLRLLPGHHGYDLADPRLREILVAAAAAGRVVQIVITLEDERTQHPRVRVADVDPGPLPAVLDGIPEARVHLLGWRPRPADLAALADLPGVFLDTSRIEGTDGVAALTGQVPAGRVAFGTHAPFLIPEAALVRVGESRLAAEAAAELLGGAARRLRAGAAPAATAPAAAPHAVAAATAPCPGLPPVETLRRYRIWDSYFTPAHAHPGRDGLESLLRDIDRSWPAVELACFERLCLFAHVGIGTTGDPALEDLLRARPGLVTAPLERFPDRLLALVHLNANDLAASLDAIDRWIGDGPMIGVYLPGGGPGARVCTDAAVERLVRRVADRRGVIMQHTWLRTGGRQGPGGSTPQDLAELARRHPGQSFICAHAGGEWEQGLRAVRDRPNVLVETSGFDATAGFIERAVREVGAGRIVFGSHLPGRSLGTELMKVLAAGITEAEKERILGANFRGLVAAVRPAGPP